MPFYSGRVSTDPNGPTDCIWLARTLVYFDAPSPHLFPIFSCAIPVLTLLLSGPAPSSWGPALEGPGAVPLPRPELCGAPLWARPGPFRGNPDEPASGTLPPALRSQVIQLPRRGRSDTLPVSRLASRCFRFAVLVSWRAAEPGL